MAQAFPASDRPAHSELLGLAALLGVCSWLVNEHYPPWRSFYNEFGAFLALWLLLVYCVSTTRSILETPRWILGVMAIAAIPFIQATLGHIYFAGDGWMAAAYALGFGLAISVGFELGIRNVINSALALAWLLLAGATVSALLVVYQWQDFHFLGLWAGSVPEGARPFANLGQPNQLATLLSLGLAALIYLRGKQILPFITAFLLVGLLIFGIVLTQSRVPWVAAVLLALWWFVKQAHAPKAKGWAIGLGLVFYSGLIIFWPLSTETPLTPPTEQRADLTRAGTHFQNWMEMVRASVNEPLWGYGWNQVAVAHTQTAHERHTYAEMLTHSHNLFLDLIIWNGLPLGLLIIGGIVYWLMIRARHCRSAESWFAILAIGCVGIHSMFEYPLDYAYFLLPVGLLVGLVEADQHPNVSLAVPKIVLWPIVVAYALFMGLVWHEYRIVEADYRLMRFETLRIGPLKADKPAPDIILLTQLREDLRMARSLARENMSAEELEWMRRITYRYPWYSSLFRYAVSLTLNGREQEGSVEFRRLYDIYGAKPYAEAKAAVQILADTRYPALKDWELPPP